MMAFTVHVLHVIFIREEKAERMKTMNMKGFTIESHE